MTLEQWLDNQKASADPAQQATAPSLQWFTGALDDEQNRQKARAAGKYPCIQFIYGDEVPSALSHEGSGIYRAASYFNIIHGVDGGVTPDPYECQLWFDVLSSLPTFYREWNIDGIGQSATATFRQITKANATNRRPKSLRTGIMMATVYCTIEVNRA
jgi:hypothetical protein